MKAMKNFIMVLLATVLCVACGQKSEYATVIPKDAPIVASMNLQALGEKASLKDYKGLIDMGLMQIKKEDAALYEQLRDIVNDPSLLGLALNEPVYIFALEGGESGAAVMKVTDADKVKQLAKQLLPQQGIECTEEGEHLWIAGPMAIVVTDQILLAGTNRLTLEKLLEQQAEESFVSTELWDELSATKGDIKMAVIPGKLAQVDEMVNQPEVTAIYDAMGIDLAENSTVAGIDFLPGKAVFTSKNHNAPKVIELQKELVGKVDGCFMDKMPANPGLWMGLNMNGDALATLLDRIVEALPATNNTNMMQVKALLANINGEVAFGMGELQTSKGTPLPDLTLFAKVKDNSWETMLNTLGNVPGLSHGMIGDDTFYLTTNSDIATNPGKKLSVSAADAPWADEAEGTYCFFTIDGEYIKQLASLSASRREMQQIEMVLNVCERIEAKALSVTEGELTLDLANKEENALKQLIQLSVSMNM